MSKRKNINVEKYQKNNPFITKIDHSSHFYCDLFIKMIGFVLEIAAMTIMVEGECKYVEDFKGGNMTWLVGIGEIDNISKMKKKAGIKK